MRGHGHVTYEFHLFAPVNIDVSTADRLPIDIYVKRDSTFAMTDIDLTTPAP